MITISRKPLKCDGCGNVHTAEQMKLGEIRMHRLRNHVLCSFCIEQFVDKKPEEYVPVPKVQLGHLTRKQAREFLDSVIDGKNLPRKNRSLVVSTLGRAFFISNTGTSFLIEETTNQRP